MGSSKPNRWKRNFLTGIFFKGNSRIVEEPHGNEGVIYLYHEGRRFVISYWNSTVKDKWWLIDGDSICELADNGLKLAVSDPDRQKIAAELNQASMDVWKKMSTT